MMQPEQWKVLSGVCQRPGMFVTPATFDAVVHFIDGYHHATGCLNGFREWLVTVGEDGNNLTWVGLVRHHLNRSEVSCDEARKIERFGEWLQQFYAYVEAFPSSREAMLRIYLDYHAWLIKRPWYQPGLPGYISPEECRRSL
jgi:hypothetical protein